MSVGAPPLRVGVVSIVVVSMFVALFARLYFLQVLDDKTLEDVRGTALFDTIATEGTRGRIIDRNGRVLVDNRESISVTIDRNVFNALEDPDAVVARLAATLTDAGFPTKEADIRSRLTDPQYNPFKPAPIIDDVTVAVEAYLLERHFDFPSVNVVRTRVRTYPYGNLAAHVLGYTGSISAAELDARPKDRSLDPKPYEPGDQIGKSGVEKVFESDLRATPGLRVIEVDARNIEVDTRSEVRPVAGYDLQLTIDVNLQAAVERELQAALLAARQQPKRSPTDPDYRAPAGAVVVLDTMTSEVLAMASFPTYDPGDFIGGISSSRFAELTDTAAFNPLFNRATQAIYSPGSTFKTFTAVAALRSGLISSGETVTDVGVWNLANCTEGCSFQNAGRTAFGSVDLRRSMVVSSDVYYYRIGEKFWVEQGTYGRTAIQDVARDFGLGSLTGVQLPDEAAGIISDPAFKAQRHLDNPTAFPFGEWLTGDNVNLAIGQGDIAVTPLQLANSYAAFANGGTLQAPSIARGLLDHDDGTVVTSFAPRVTRKVALDPGIRSVITDGLTGVVNSNEGTAAGAFAGFAAPGFVVAGKTGTAEAPPRADTAIFASFAPVAAPRYVVVAVLEEAGFASGTAAPLVRRIYDQIVAPVEAQPVSSSIQRTPAVTASTLPLLPVTVAPTIPPVPRTGGRRPPVGRRRWR